MFTAQQTGCHQRALDENFLVKWYNYCVVRIILVSHKLVSFHLIAWYRFPTVFSIWINYKIMAEVGTASFLRLAFFHPPNELTKTVIRTLPLPMTPWKLCGSGLQQCDCCSSLVGFGCTPMFLRRLLLFLPTECIGWVMLLVFNSCTAGWRSVSAVGGVKWWVPGVSLMSAWGCLVPLQGSEYACWVISRRLWRTGMCVVFWLRFPCGCGAGDQVDWWVWVCAW